MSDTTRLTLPYLAAGQAQKHVTVNESLRRLDALVQLSAISATTAAQPGSPSDGDIYLLPGGKTGAAWGAMADGALAYYRDGAWEQLTPRPGWRCYAQDVDALYARGASTWQRIAAREERRIIFTPGGDGVVSIYRIDTARAQNPRTAAISSIVSDVITLTTTDAGLFFGANMAGVSYLRIWNTSKTPNQSAWVKQSPANNQLKVVDAAALSGWAAGETIQIGDPTSVTPNRFIALDISPMMQAVLGRVFRQAGVLTRCIVAGASVQASVGICEAGVTGTAQSTKSYTDGTLGLGQNIVPCSVLSPISNSNLVFVQEAVAGTAIGICGVSALGVLV
ncbi:MAG: DUF2793 domain-containing protein [Vitreimonas sp.]